MPHPRSGRRSHKVRERGAPCRTASPISTTLATPLLPLFSVIGMAFCPPISACALKRLTVRSNRYRRTGTLACQVPGSTPPLRNETTHKRNNCEKESMRDGIDEEQARRRKAPPLKRRATGLPGSAKCCSPPAKPGLRMIHRATPGLMHANISVSFRGPAFSVGPRNLSERFLATLEMTQRRVPSPTADSVPHHEWDLGVPHPRLARVGGRRARPPIADNAALQGLGEIPHPDIHRRGSE